MIGLRTLCAAVVAAALQTPALPVASPDIQHFVRDALADRLAARDIPDLPAAPATGPQIIAIDAAMPAARVALTADAVPQLPGFRLSLTSAAETRALAERTHRNVWFITVDRPAIDGDRASVWLGVDFASPARSGDVKLCCCESRGEFTRSGDRWVFVKWTASRCA